jgi:ABC-type antimicrobial peptide transport system ATPase subunit
VWQQKEEFLRVLRDNQTLILVGETGSGKTTQVRQSGLQYPGAFDVLIYYLLLRLGDIGVTLEIIHLLLW